MGSPIKPKYPLFLRDIDKGGSFSTIVVEDNFNIDAKPGVFYDIKNKENDEININLEDNNNNQFLINCPCSLSFNKDINWVELDEPNLIVPIQMLITVVNNIASYKPIVDNSGDNDKVIVYKYINKPNINATDTDYRKDSDFICYKNYNNFGIIIKFNGIYNEDKIQIIDSYITNISDLSYPICYSEDKNITEIIYPNNSPRLTYLSFNNLKNLHKINIPKKCKFVDFSNASIDILNNIVYKYDNLMYIDNWLIRNPYDVEYIIIKEGTIGIASNFNEHKIIDITEIKFPKSLKYINDYAFYNCNISEVYLNEGLLEIGNYAFNKNVSIILPNSLEYLGEDVGHIDLSINGKSVYKDSYAGHHIGKIIYYIVECFTETLIIEEGITQIYHNASSGCNGKDIVKTIILPNTLKYIGNNALSEFISLEHITIPDSVEYIVNNAFMYCENLKTITTAKGTYNVGEYGAEIELANGTFVYLYTNEEYYECVLPETEILINNQGDTKQIKDLQIGDTVITNKNNNLIETTINKLVQVQHNSYLKVTLENNDILNISLDHNICTKYGWKCYNDTISKNKECVGKLTIGDEVLTTNGFVKIVSIEMINKDNTIMYNIGVKKGNNYYANGICVYECDK